MTKVDPSKINERSNGWINFKKVEILYVMIRFLENEDSVGNPTVASQENGPFRYEIRTLI
jgi:hypothetical protein